MQLYFQSEGAGPALIIMHGLFGSSANWRVVAKHFSASYQVMCLDLRNHGRSPHDADMSYASMAADLDEFIQQQALSSVRIIGHSMGGKAAMLYALNKPNLIESLVIVDIAPVVYHHDFDDILSALKNLPLDQIRNRREADAHLAERIPGLGLRQFLLQNLALVQGQYQWRINIDAIADQVPSIVSFPNVGSVFLGHTLFVQGAKSKYISDEYKDELFSYFPNARITKIDNAGHWVHAEQVDKFLTAVDDFL